LYNSRVSPGFAAGLTLAITASKDTFSVICPSG
jgi:hypothetical protein